MNSHTIRSFTDELTKISQNNGYKNIGGEGYVYPTERSFGVATLGASHRHVARTIFSTRPKGSASVQYIGAAEGAKRAVEDWWPADVTHHLVLHGAWLMDANDSALRRPDGDTE